VAVRETPVGMATLRGWADNLRRTWMDIGRKDPSRVCGWSDLLSACSIVPSFGRADFGLPGRESAWSRVGCWSRETEEHTVIFTI
jgi:hypothetical protein